MGKNIGTDYPGYNVFVLYHGIPMTPEDLGNYTYGCIGRHFGFSLEVLRLGSLYAAGFPQSGTALWNEKMDQHYIANGYLNNYK